MTGRPSNGQTSTPPEDLALTNLMLARLRPLLGARAEASVKWYAIGAFNGAVLECGGRSAELQFYRDPPPEGAPDYVQTYRVSCGYAVVITGGEFWLSGVRDTLAAAEEEFLVLRGSTPDRLTQVARYQVCLISQASAATANTDHERIAAALVATTGGTAAVACSPFEFPDGSGAWNGDLEVVLPALVQEATLRARLATFLTNLGDQALFGLGATWSNNGGHCPDPSLRYVRLIARQF